MKKKSSKILKSEEYINNIKTTNFNVFIGIDSGTNQTGLSILSQNSDNRLVLIKANKNDLVVERIQDVVDFFSVKLCHLISLHRSDKILVLIEKPFGIKGQGRVLLELIGVLKYKLNQQNISFLEVSQTTVKKFATGTGRAEKSEMVLRAYKEFGIENVSEDEVDAFWISQLAKAIKYKPIEKYRQECVTIILTKIIT